MTSQSMITTAQNFVGRTSSFEAARAIQYERERVAADRQKEAAEREVTRQRIAIKGWMTAS